MSPELVLSSAQLPPLKEATGDFASQCHALLIQQKLTWEMLRANYANLDAIETRTMEIEGYLIRLQFNPTRLTSSAAKVDEKSIRERKCFLCPGHLPAEQRALPFEDDYLVLCNPFPIFPEHFTIPHREHVPQLITDSFGTMLELTRGMGSRYTVFYNGPRCGASAPDHLHFQASTRHFMPLEIEYQRFLNDCGRSIHTAPSLRICAVSGGLRRFVTIESSEADLIEEAFAAFYAAHQTIAASSEEPMLNMLSMWIDDGWRLVLFPRAKHRPDFFFAEGDDRILLSPASVDLGGLCVVPVERDFRRLNESHIRQMFQEVCLSEDAFGGLCGEFAKGVKNL